VENGVLNRNEVNINRLVFSQNLCLESDVVHNKKTMKNPDQEPLENEEIPNIEQFQIDRSVGNAADGYAENEEEDDIINDEFTDDVTPEPGEFDDEDADELSEDDQDYTEDEIPFADGKGTPLDEIIGDSEEENDDI